MHRHHEQSSASVSEHRRFRVLVDIVIDNGCVQYGRSLIQRNEGRFWPNSIPLSLTLHDKVVALLATGQRREASHSARVVAPLADPIDEGHWLTICSIHPLVDGD